MNIFWVDRILRTCARSLCDQHRSRMIYEKCVILNNAYYSTDEIFLIKDIYKKHYYNHPQCRWARANLTNFETVRTYLSHLLEAYYESGGTKWQKEASFLKSYQENPPTLPKGSLLSSYLTFGNHNNLTLNRKYKAVQAQFGDWNPDLKVWETANFDVAVEAYRTYYKMKIFKGGVLPIWTHNTRPSWYVHTDVALIN